MTHIKRFLGRIGNDIVNVMKVVASALIGILIIGLIYGIIRISLCKESSEFDGLTSGCEIAGVFLTGIFFTLSISVFSWIKVRWEETSG